MEKGINDIKDDKNEKKYEEKEAECLDDTSPDEMEEVVRDKKMTRMIKTMRRTRQNA